MIFVALDFGHWFQKSSIELKLRTVKINLACDVLIIFPLKAEPPFLRLVLDQLGDGAEVFR